MKRVAIIAPTGMLGSMVYNVLKDSYSLVLVYRSDKNLQLLDSVYGGVAKQRKVKIDFENLYKEYLVGSSDFVPTKENKLFHLDADAVINCGGLTKPHSLENPAQTFFINSALPQLLSSVYKEKLIQIATDCVFSGLEGAPYNEKAVHNPVDVYGLSKSLGEPSQKSLVLRTSIIGPEINNFVLLVSWLKSQKQANGYTNHLWNGITTRQFALSCDKIIQKRSAFPANGLFHVFSNKITKLDLLALLAKKYNPSCEITPIAAETAIDRRLSTIYPLNAQLKIPSIEKQIREL